MTVFLSELRLDRFKKGNKFAFGKGKGKGVMPPTAEEKAMGKDPEKMAQMKGQLEEMKSSGKSFSPAYFKLLKTYNKAKTAS